MSGKKCECLDDREVIDINTIGYVSILSPIPKVWKRDGKGNNSNGKSQRVKGWSKVEPFYTKEE